MRRCATGVRGYVKRRMWCRAHTAELSSAHHGEFDATYQLARGHPVVPHSALVTVVAGALLRGGGE